MVGNILHKIVGIILPHQQALNEYYNPMKIFPIRIGNIYYSDVAVLRVSAISGREDTQQSLILGLQIWNAAPLVISNQNLVLVKVLAPHTKRRSRRSTLSPASSSSSSGTGTSLLLCNFGCRYGVKEMQAAESTLGALLGAKWGRAYSQMLGYVPAMMLEVIVCNSTLLLCGSHKRCKAPHITIIDGVAMVAWETGNLDTVSNYWLCVAHVLIHVTNIQWGSSFFTCRRFRMIYVGFPQ